MLTRKDFTGFEWFSNIGGLTFLFSFGAMFASALDSPSMLVTSAMLASGQAHKVGSSKISRTVSLTMFGKNNVEAGCCINLRTKIATAKYMPRKVRKCVGGARASLMNEAN